MPLAGLYGNLPYMETPLFYPPRYTAFVMPKASKLNLMPLPPSDETPGRRLARIRRERGFTQIELAEQTGLVQTLVSDYERGKLRLNTDMIFRFAPRSKSLPTRCCSRPGRLNRRSRAARCCDAWNRSRPCPPPSRWRCCGLSTRFWPARRCRLPGERHDRGGTTRTPTAQSSGCPLRWPPSFI